MGTKDNKNKEEEEREDNKDKKKPFLPNTSKNLRKSHVFQVVLEFYVRQIELTFSVN